MFKSVLSTAIVLPISVALITSTPAAAQSKRCKLNVVGGSQKGRSFNLEMRNGKFVGAGMQDSTLSDCRGMRNIHGRWYHICGNGRVIVFRWVENTKTWRRLAEHNLQKYRHNCF